MISVCEHETANYYGSTFVLQIEQVRLVSTSTILVAFVPVFEALAYVWVV